MRIKGTVAYEGTNFEGWQSQASGNTVQDILEKRLEYLLKTPTRIHGASRTDSGVHARGQVFHFDADWSHDLKYLLRGFRSNMPPGIQVLELEAVSPDFHARFHALEKRYTYYLQEGHASPFTTRYRWSLGNRELDIEAMKRGAPTLVGTHDFTAFSGTAPRARDPNPVKDLRVLEVGKTGLEYQITAVGSGFLYKMVRCLVGALVQVGMGRLKPEALAGILEKRVRTAEVPTAPARGLFLEEVVYETLNEECPCTG